MAGRPIERALLAAIEERGGFEVIIEGIASGRTIASYAREFGVSRNFMSTILHRDEERSRRVRKAQQEAAEALAEESLEIADSASPAVPNSDRVAKVRIEQRRWMAGRLDPERFGDKQAPLIQINAGDLHLHALREIERNYDQRTLQTGGRQIEGDVSRMPETAVFASPSRVIDVLPTECVTNAVTNAASDHLGSTT